MSRQIILLIFCLSMGCSGFQHIDLQDPTESEWTEIKGNKECRCEIIQRNINRKIDEDQQKRKKQKTSTTKRYKTPLAGTPLKVKLSSAQIHILPFLFPLSVEGREVSILERDRRNVTAISLGAIMYNPSIGAPAQPLAAFFHRKHWYKNDRRLRAILVGVVNFIDFADSTWNSHGIEALFHWENNVIPVKKSEFIGKEEAEFTSMEWGYVRGGIGIGWRQKIAPYHFDNDFRIQLFYEPGYLYTKVGEQNEKSIEKPEDTAEHRLHLLMRYDAFDRNFLELLHRGWAWGADAIIGRRDNWSDHSFNKTYFFTNEETRDYLRLSSYIFLATGIPAMDEKHTLLLSAHAGWSPRGNWDRFNAFRLGGGPPPTETNDLYRQPLAGAIFDQFIAEKYILATIEYRFEVEFYLYFHIRGSFVWGTFGFLEQNEKDNVDGGKAFSAAITSGFLWDSLLYFEYTLNDGFVRQGKTGHSFLISWSKQF